MPEMTLQHLLERAMELHGADGLYNEEGPCGCGKDDLSPGDCLSVGCVLAQSKVLTDEGECDDISQVGDTVYYPIQLPDAVFTKDT